MDLRVKPEDDRERKSHAPTLHGHAAPCDILVITQGDPASIVLQFNNFLHYQLKCFLRGVTVLPVHQDAQYFFC